MRTTKERLAQLHASERRNEKSIRAFIDRDAYRLGDGDDREWMLAHYEKRLAELMAMGAHRIRPDITDRYEEEIMDLGLKIERARRKEESKCMI